MNRLKQYDAWVMGIMGKHLGNKRVLAHPIVALVIAGYISVPVGIVKGIISAVSFVINLF